ncbi:MAG: hypothetical protein GX666_04040 [Tissierellia bacterium]|nr:hypothetical protein [Tissierellia bacterium]
MDFKLPKYNAPNWQDEKIINSSDVKLSPAKGDGILPDGFYLTSIYPEYLKLNGQWILVEDNTPFTLLVVKDKKIIPTEAESIKKGDLVVCANTSDGSMGLFANEHPFDGLEYNFDLLSYDVSGSEKYDKMVAILEAEKNNENGYIIWVLGPAVVFDYDTRVAISELIEEGYVDCIMAGNAMATHDLEGGYLETALGQNIYTQESMPNGHYNHLDTINEARRLGSIEAFVESGEVEDGLMKKLIEKKIPYVLAGSIRDDGPLPPVYADSFDAVLAMEEELKKATLVITLATQLHSVGAASMVPCYRVENGNIRPVYVYSIDVSDYSTASVMRVRDNYGVESFLTNVQDFSYIMKQKLIK